MGSLWNEVFVGWGLCRIGSLWDSGMGSHVSVDWASGICSLWNEVTVECVLYGMESLWNGFSEERAFCGIRSLGNWVSGEWDLC